MHHPTPKVHQYHQGNCVSFRCLFRIDCRNEYVVFLDIVSAGLQRNMKSKAFSPIRLKLKLILILVDRLSGMAGPGANRIESNLMNLPVVGTYSYVR